MINSIDLETGKKYQSNKKQREFVKQANDTLCHEHGLSVPEKQRETRYTQAEYEIGKEAQKGNKPIPWKEQIRMVIDQTHAINYEQLGTDLLKQNGIKIERITEKTITYKHLEEDKKVRGSKLGEKYDKRGLEHGYRLQELNPENDKILKKLDQIEKQLNQSGTTSQKTPENSQVIDEVLKQQDLLMRNLSEIKKNEKEREKNHKALLENLKDSTSNFNQATKNTEDKFISVARSYLRKLNTDNQQQDFKQAFDEKFKDLDKQASDLFEHYKKHNDQARKETIEYKKAITDTLR